MLGPCWQKLFALNCLAPDHSAICPATLSVVSKNGGMLLANSEISLYCPIIRFLVDQNKINNKTCMAGVYVCSDIGREVCFLPICYKNYFCSIKIDQSDALQGRVPEACG